MKDKIKRRVLGGLPLFFLGGFLFASSGAAPNNTVVIDGQGNRLNLSSTSNIFVSEDERLVLKNLKLNNLSGERLIMEGPNSHLELQNVNILLDGNYSFTMGTMFFRDNVSIGGTYTFGYNSSQNSTIDSYSTLLLDENLTWSWGAPVGNIQGNIYFTDGTSRLTMNNSGIINIITINLNDGATIILGDVPIELPANENININGENNYINITNRFTITGNLVFAEGSELTFVFNDLADNPVVYFNRSSLSLPKNAKMSFSGNGTVIFKDGFVLNMNGTNNTDRPELSFFHSASGTIEAAARRGSISKFYIRGYGTIFLDSGGEINIGTSRHLIIGGRGVGLDNFVIYADRGAAIKAIGYRAFVSIFQATVSMDFEQRASLVAGQQGVVAINANARTLQPAGGALSSLTFDTDGALNSRVNGTIVFGENTGSTPFIWSSKGGDVYGEGEIMLAEQNTFDGIGKGVERIFNSNSITAEELVRRLVNLKKNSILPQSANFERFGGNQYVRIKSSTILGLVAALVPIRQLNNQTILGETSVSDVIISEDPTSVGGRSVVTNENFYYDLQGNRYGAFR